MKNFFIILIFPFLLACSKGISTNQTNGNPAQTEINFPSKAYLVSTYDDPQFADVLQNQREILEKLSIGKEFEIISLHLIKSLPEKHQKYFKTKSMYELLCVADGNLFENDKKDYAFSVYDKKNVRISIITYNEKKDQYSELYRDIKVENGLNEAVCNYATFGTLDYQLANAITEQEESIQKKPLSFLENSSLKITDISKDADLNLESGCFSKKTLKNNMQISLCVATSSIYNNWECLKYDKTTNTFLIFYGQAFAD